MLPPEYPGGERGIVKAQEYFDKIKDGHKNTMQRPPNTYIDRTLRQMVEDANNNGDCIINVGKGYYRPVPGDSVDEAELNRYLATELARARKIQKKRLNMKLTFERWKDGELYTRYTGQARRVE